MCALASVIWMVAGYSLAFTNGNPYIGDLSRLFLNGFGEGWDKPFTLAAGTDVAVPTTIPESVFMMFQMTFAIITPALISGAFADRMKFSAMMVFMALWSLLVYAPVAHWIFFPGGWLAGLGAADFAGGTVVHVNAGVAGLVCAIVLGKRVGYGHENLAPFNLSYAVLGAALLWVGWFGFNAGSALGANGRAGMAMTVTQVAAGGGTLAWLIAEWVAKGKPSVLGGISGAVAGLVAITPASGFVLPGPALIIGLFSGVSCFWSATAMKHALSSCPSSRPGSPELTAKAEKPSAPSTMPATTTGLRPNLSARAPAAVIATSSTAGATATTAPNATRDTPRRSTATT